MREGGHEGAHTTIPAMIPSVSTAVRDTRARLPYTRATPMLTITGDQETTKAV